jgi:hypothetical protein
MPEDPDQTRREDARWAVLQALTRRPTGAFEATTVRSNFLKGHDFTLTEVEAALAFLLSAEFVKVAPDSMGSTKFYQVTHKGILAFENR